MPKAKKTERRGLETTEKKLDRGDIVEVEWSDTHSLDRMTSGEVEEMGDPGSTLSYGVVLRDTRRYLTIASELCLDMSSDCYWVEQIPHGTIKAVRKLGRREIESEG
jgi:hypothetical protein